MHDRDRALTLAESSVPRYTSYPTAPHFGPEVGPAAYGRWLAEAGAGPLSLYIHVPYCRVLCLYCGCHTKATRRGQPLDTYTRYLAEEIAIVARHVGAGRVSQLHWGGGTPSILGPERLTQIFSRLVQGFDVSGLFEHAIELDPRYVEPPLVAALARIGVTRASLGVQDFSPHVQQAIGRLQPFAQVAKAVAMLRDAGIAALNFDLMYGLPGQRVTDVARSAELALSLRPQRIALFGYAHVPWFKPQQRLIDQAQLPGAAERIAQMRAAQALFAAAGYDAIGLDHFALPTDELALAAREGRLRRNFQGYTNDSAPALIGLGASAVSRLPQGYAQNATDVAGYARAVGSGAPATRRGIALTADDRLRAHIIERLMCDLGVDLAAAARDFGTTASFAREREEVRTLAAEGIVEIVGDRVKVTEQGRPFVRIVAAVFDAYRAESRRRHSVAV